MQATTPSPGRPREFDTDAALEGAMRTFWARGYEGSSLTDLTAAMGISKPSMYAAFGTKEQLFTKVLERYVDGPAAYAERALEEPSALGVVAALLNGAVTSTTSPGQPAGCLTVQGALPDSDGGRPAHDLLVRWRSHAAARLADRFRRAIDDGDLPTGTDADALARYCMALSFGIAVQAATGLGRAELTSIAEAALRGWRAVAAG
jgi:AcrR family transcriptional regulator